MQKGGKNNPSQAKNIEGPKTSLINMLHRGIESVFAGLFFLVPLFFFPNTSELFEFNKLIVLYIATILMGGMWISEMIIARKVIFRRTVLDIPLLLFLISLCLSTLFSLDQRTSLFGYYSRWNGGLLSMVCYLLLYWLFVSHQTIRVGRLITMLFVSTTVASVWGVLEHLGHSPSCLIITGQFDVACWIQDVKLRVYATFGQPNWMAAWMAAILPLVWDRMIVASKKTIRTKKFAIYTALSTLYFASLLFTKSKSGLIAFVISFVLFWGLTILKNKTAAKKIVPACTIAAIMIGIICGIDGTPWTPSLGSLLSRQTEITETPQTQAGTSLENGGTDSGVIRQIVWNGAYTVWTQFPLFGSGVETFGLSYYRGRPLAHNNTSEWNFLYNKAHNEYLNYLATTGLIGFIAYVSVIGGTLVVLWRRINSGDDTNFAIGLLSGYLTILVTNFFGFSVVPISLLFFVIPALALSEQLKKKITEPVQIDGTQKAAIGSIIFVCGLLGFGVLQYWSADLSYARAQTAQRTGDYARAIAFFRGAINLSPSEALYHVDLASAYADLAVAELGAEEKQLSDSFMNAAVETVDTARTLSPSNVRILKAAANTYATLGDREPEYFLKTLEVTERLASIAPTDPSVHYQRALTLAKIGYTKEAIVSAEIAVNMKEDYKIARRLLGYLYGSEKDTENARKHLRYILDRISPDDIDVQKQLESLK